MRRTKTNKGFTLGETLIVVGIILVLVSLGVVAVWNYMRSLHQLEMDGIAKEIFVAAQNHLTMADSQGLLSRVVYPVEAESADVYYYVVGNTTDSYPDDTADRALDLMLPFASVDDTVRLGGSYIIRYQRSTARVLDVFFDWKEEDNRFGHNFSEAEYSLLVNRYRGDDNRRARRNYGDDKKVIGWYGGDDADTLPRGDTILAPTVEVINAERLWVRITNPNTGTGNNQAGLRLIITGETSGKRSKIDLIDNNTGLLITTGVSPHPLQDGNTTRENLTVLLDDVTDEGKHFRDLFSTFMFIPGENITVQAVAYNNRALTNVAYSAGVTTNSLFGDLQTSDGDDAAVTAFNARVTISNIRHLENLHAGISGIDPDYRIGTGTERITVKSARQSGDLDWRQFMSDITGKDVGVTGFDRVKVYPIGSSPDGEGCFYPVDLALGTTYDGGKHDILNLNVNHDGAAGAFGTLKHCTLQDVYVYNTVDDDTDLTIQGTGDAGGLVGKMTGGQVKGCAAAVYVQSTGGNAGGLVGSASEAKLAGSYSGGHTVDGSYLAQDTGRGRFNVQSTGGNAGGLAGSVSGTDVEHCYSTCSVSAGTAGGLVGSAENGSITSSYCTGLVRGGTAAGAFAGSVNSVALGTGGQKNHCFGIINPGMAAIASGGDSTKIGSIDESMETYADFYPADPTRPAAPYDDTLQTEYRGYYPLKNVTKVATHYGDWPVPEAFVINR